GRHVLTLLGEHIEHVRIHPVIRIAHRLAPERLALGRELARPALALMERGGMHDEIAEEVQHAPRLLLTEASEDAERAARVERKDRLEVRRLLLGGVELLGAEAGNSDHADIAVAPGLARDPFDQIIAVPLPAAATLRFEDAARRADDVRVAARHEKL